MFRNMAKSLVTHGKIRTTVVKAKELRKVADKLVALALRNDLHARRQAYKVLGSHQLVKKLFDEIGPAFVGVQGGFTRVVKLGLPRPGDNATLAVIEFTRKPGDATLEPKASKQAAAPAPAPAATPVEESAPAPAAETAPDTAVAPGEKAE